MAERLNLTVDDGIGEKLAELAGSRNRMGEMVSSLVRAAREVDQVPATSDTETLRLMVLGLSAEIKQMKRKIAAAHRQMTYESRLNQERINFLMNELGLDPEVKSRIALFTDCEYIDDCYGDPVDLFGTE